MFYGIDPSAEPKFRPILKGGLKQVKSFPFENVHLQMKKWRQKS